MRTLYTVSYPDVSAEDRAFIERLRHVNDVPYRDLVAMHFTMVFGIRDLPDEQYTEHVCRVANSSGEVPFVCRYAMLGADDQDETAYVFLVPDEGYSAASLLHDRLYRGPFEPFHRLDIPYIPHITIATLQDRSEAKRLCDQLNRDGLSISGVLRSLTVGALQDGKFVNQHEVRLGAA